MNSDIIDIDQLISQVYIHLYPQDVNSSTIDLVTGSFIQSAQEGYKNAINKATTQLLNSTMLKINGKETTAKEFTQIYGKNNLQLDLENAFTEAGEQMTQQFSNIQGDLTEAINNVYQIINDNKRIGKTALNEWSNAIWEALAQININEEAYQKLLTLEEASQQGQSTITEADAATLKMVNDIIEKINNAENKRKSNKYGRLKKASLRGSTRYILGSQLGEVYGQRLAESLDPNNLTDEIDKSVWRALSNITLSPGSAFSSIKRTGQKTTEITSTTVKPDIISENALFTVNKYINGQNLSFDILINSSIKEYRYKRPNFIHIVGGTPITTVWKDHVNTRESLYTAYNAIVHKEEFNEAYNSLKELIAGNYFVQYLMGTGEKISGGGNDTAWFMIVGKEVYSMLDIIKNVVSDKPGTSSIIIKFDGEKGIKNEKENQYQNVLTNAKKRSDNIKEAINKIKITALLNAKFYKT